MSSPVSTGCLHAVVPSRCVTSQLGQLSVAFLRGLNQVSAFIGWGETRTSHLSSGRQHCMSSCGMLVPLVVKLVCELLDSVYLLLNCE